MDSCLTNAQTHDIMNTHEVKLPHWKQKLSDFLGEVHHHLWESFLMNNYCDYLLSYLFHIWLKSMSKVVKLGSIPSWYQKVGLSIGSQMGPQETPCCNVMGISLEKGSPINFVGWTIPLFDSIFSIMISSMSLLWNVVIMLSSTLDKSDSEIDWPFLAKLHPTFSTYFLS
jgi:hypothetical protein